MIIETAMKSLDKEISKAKGDTISGGALFFTIVLILGICFGLLCLGWWIGMLLWNYIVCTAWGLSYGLTFWQFAGFDILCSMLFKSSSSKSD